MRDTPSAEEAQEAESGAPAAERDLAVTPGEEPELPGQRQRRPASDADGETPEVASTAWDLDRAIELWQTRVDIAKSTFVANGRLNDAQALHFETALVAMNIRIGATIDEFADSIRDADEVQPEAGIRLVNAITDAMVTTYDEMDETLPQGWRRRAGQSFSLTDFIDPEVARPMVGLEDRLQF
jgi:hypothetical protein